MKNQKGFTLIELVVVIVILGILAAVAVPKFVDMQEDAKKAATEGASAALNSGISLTHAKWLVAGGGTTATLQTGVVVGVNPSGWPAGASGTVAVGANADCTALWGLLLSTSSMTAGTTGAEDFIAANSAGVVCTYTYDDGTTNYVITYDSASGAVTGP